VIGQDGMAKKSTYAEEMKAVAVRVGQEEFELIEKLVCRHPRVGRSTIIRAALGVGLEAIDRNPSILLEKPKTSR
jgi:hypothetical protein